MRLRYLVMEREYTTPIGIAIESAETRVQLLRELAVLAIAFNIEIIQSALGGRSLVIPQRRSRI